MKRTLQSKVKKTERSGTRASALVTVLVFVLVVSLLVGAAVLRAMTRYELAWNNGRSEAAHLVAEGGINDEVQFISLNQGSTTITGLSSQPVAANGETAKYPGDGGAVIKGRKSFVDGYPNKPFWVYSSMDRAGTTGWDGRAPDFWITATAYVDHDWRRVRVQARKVSVFTLHAIFALAAYQNNSNAIQMSNATVVVVGTGGTNGQITNGNSTLTVSNAINANTSVVTTGQFTNSNLASGGSIYTQPGPYSYPTVATVLKRFLGRSSDTDSQVWTYLSTNNSNYLSSNSKIYTYASHPSSGTISAANCVRANIGSTVLNTNTWSNAAYKPNTYVNGSLKTVTAATNTTPIEITTSANHGLNTGDSVFVTGVGGNTAANGNWTITKTGAKSFQLNTSIGNGAYSSGGSSYQNILQTLIFEPGDYYFTSVQVSYMSNIELVIDTQAYATGGTPGQVRFWIYDPANGNQNDTIEIPVATTLASGQTTPDPSLFRLYYAKDGKAFTFNRKSSVTSWDGTALAGNFNVYGGVYAVTKVPGNTDNQLKGTQINFQGGNNGSETIVLKGSLLADKLSFSGPCRIEFIATDNTDDPFEGVGITGGYSEGD